MGAGDAGSCRAAYSYQTSCFLEELNPHLSPGKCMALPTHRTKVRTAREKPAHALRTNVTDRTFIHKQRDVLHDDVDEVLINSRHGLASLPWNRDWEEPRPDAEDHPL
ncbi:hypothetical protein AHiyo4_20950 [Arthrobacter sp. Hiyo4]|nr:hypothetical protein AHiyo4_20950 [Arthrobacter sp. Hiyo4]